MARVPGVRRIVINENRRRFRKRRVVEAFYLSRGQQAVREWTAYDAAGQRLSSGTLN